MASTAGETLSTAEQGPDGRKEEGEEEQIVNPWEVSAKGGKIDYDKLVDKFGCQRLDQSLIDRFERITGRRAHVFLRRGLFFAHRFVLFSFGLLLYFVEAFCYFYLDFSHHFITGEYSRTLNGGRHNLNVLFVDLYL
jgi:hypothetical protein